MPKASSSASGSPSKSAPYTTTSPKKGTVGKADAPKSRFVIPKNSGVYRCTDMGADVWISGWDAWQFFNTHRDTIAEYGLNGPSPKKFWLYQIHGLAEYQTTPENALKCRRNFLAKNQNKTEEIWARMGLGVDQNDGYGCEDTGGYDDDVSMTCRGVTIQA